MHTFRCLGAAAASPHSHPSVCARAARAAANPRAAPGGGCTLSNTRCTPAPTLLATSTPIQTVWDVGPFEAQPHVDDYARPPLSVPQHINTAATSQPSGAGKNVRRLRIDDVQPRLLRPRRSLLPADGVDDCHRPYCQRLRPRQRHRPLLFGHKALTPSTPPKLEFVVALGLLYFFALYARSARICTRCRACIMTSRSCRRQGTKGIRWGMSLDAHSHYDRLLCLPCILSVMYTLPLTRAKEAAERRDADSDAAMQLSRARGPGQAVRCNLCSTGPFSTCLRPQPKILVCKPRSYARVGLE
eukprot:2928116-Pleurochrysis_carterae.AAC.1